LGEPEQDLTGAFITLLIGEPFKGFARFLIAPGFSQAQCPRISEIIVLREFPVKLFENEQSLSISPCTVEGECLNVARFSCFPTHIAPILTVIFP
jgi:hypothetical protein